MATEPIGIPSQPADPHLLRRSDTDRGGEVDRSGATREGQRRADSAAKPESGATGEKVQISQAAQELLRTSELMNTARQKLDAQPAVRADRIREVRERLAAGVYDTRAIRDELALRLSSVLGDLPLPEAPDAPER